MIVMISSHLVHCRRAEANISKCHCVYCDRSCNLNNIYFIDWENMYEEIHVPTKVCSSNFMDLISVKNYKSKSAHFITTSLMLPWCL